MSSQIAFDILISKAEHRRQIGFQLLFLTVSRCFSRALTVQETPRQLFHMRKRSETAAKPELPATWRSADASLTSPRAHQY